MCVQAGGRGEAAWARTPSGACASNAGGPVAKMTAGPGDPGGRLLRWRKSLQLFFPQASYTQGFHAVGLFWLRWCKGFKGMQLQKLEHIVGRKGFKAF